MKPYKLLYPKTSESIFLPTETLVIQEFDTPKEALKFVNDMKIKSYILTKSNGTILSEYEVMQQGSLFWTMRAVNFIGQNWIGILAIVAFVFFVKYFKYE